MLSASCLKCGDDFAGTCALIAYKKYADQYTNHKDEIAQKPFDIDHYNDPQFELVLKAKNLFMRRHLHSDHSALRCSFQTDVIKCHALNTLCTMIQDGTLGITYLSEIEQAHVIFYHRKEYIKFTKDEQGRRRGRFGRAVYEQHMFEEQQLRFIEEDVSPPVSMTADDEKQVPRSFITSGYSVTAVSVTSPTPPITPTLIPIETITEPIPIQFSSSDSLPIGSPHLPPLNYTESVTYHKRNARKHRKTPTPTDIVSFGYEFKSTKTRWNTLKEEVLQCEKLKDSGKQITMREWDNLMRCAPGYVKHEQAKSMGMNVNDVVGLKLYTDFTDIQREYRRCFRVEDETERMQFQSHFVHWNTMLVAACLKGNEIVTKPLYHGLGLVTRASTFNGKYFGPVSTTTNFEVARSFSAQKGVVLQLEPLYNTKGIWVQWFSSYFLEEEVLYMNVTFGIADIFDAQTGKSKLAPPTMLTSMSQQFSTSLPEDARSRQLDDLAKVLKSSWSELNANSAVLSLNRDSIKPDNAFCHLADGSKICILQLLYLQYDDQRLEQFHDEDALNILNEVKQQFVGIIEGVRAVQMDDISLSIQHFLSADQHDYQYDQTFDRTEAEDLDPNEPLHFKLQTIIRLFPFAEEISLNAKNWDFSLCTFRQFVDKWRLDFSDISIKYIDIKFDEDGSKRTDGERAVEMMKQCDAAENISYLSRMGWRFLTPCKLSNVGFDPKPEIPFLVTFMEKKEDELFMIDSYTNKVLNMDPEVPSERFSEGLLCSASLKSANNSLSRKEQLDEVSDLCKSPMSPSLRNEEKIEEKMEESTVWCRQYTPFMPSRANFDGLAESYQSVNSPGRDDISAGALSLAASRSEGHPNKSIKIQSRVIQHNPKICCLSKEIWKMMEVENYKEKLMKMLKRMKLGSPKGPGSMEDQPFLEACTKVRILTLDPMPKDLYPIFRDQDGNVDYGSISFIFPCG